MILRQLIENGRIPLQRLAEMIYLSPTAVVERVRRLERDGFIQGYQARINPGMVQSKTLAYVDVRLQRSTTVTMASFHAGVKARADILECHQVAGDFDYLLKVCLEEEEAASGAWPRCIVALPEVREIRVHPLRASVYKPVPSFLAQR